MSELPPPTGERTPSIEEPAWEIPTTPEARITPCRWGYNIIAHEGALVSTGGGSYTWRPTLAGAEAAATRMVARLERRQAERARRQRATVVVRGPHSARSDAQAAETGKDTPETGNGNQEAL